MIVNHANSSVVLSSLMDNAQTKPLLEKALSNYPLYEGKKKYELIPTRNTLNEKILNHYKYREIGFETVGRFLFELENTMNLIMPYYNELFKTIEIMADLENPFDNVDITETFEEIKTGNTTNTGNLTGNQETDTTETTNATTNGTTTEKSTGTSTAVSSATSTDNTTGNKTKKFSDTPQNSVSNINNYLTEYTDEGTTGTTTNNTSSSTSGDNETNNTITTNTTDKATNEGTAKATNTTETESTSEMETTVSHTFTRKGNHGVNTFAHDILKYREQIIDVVNKIVTDKRINELFMLVW